MSFILTSTIILIEARIKIFKNETSILRMFNAIIDRNIASLIESITAPVLLDFLHCLATSPSKKSNNNIKSARRIDGLFLKTNKLRASAKSVTTLG